MSMSIDMGIMELYNFMYYEGHKFGTLLIYGENRSSCAAHIYTARTRYPGKELGESGRTWSYDV